MQVEGRLPREIGFGRVAVDPPREAGHGDLSTNAAMVLARDAKLKPRELAEPLAEWLRAHKYWPPVARVNNVLGDRNLVCSCPPTDSYA